MKKLATMVSLVMATGLTVSAQEAATKVTTTTKSTTTHKNVKQRQKQNRKKSKSTKHQKILNSTKASAKAKKAAKVAPRTSEVNIDIPADLKSTKAATNLLRQSRLRNTQAKSWDCFPVVKVTQTGPAV